jgi:hypothetical protein
MVSRLCAYPSIGANEAIAIAVAKFDQNIFK